MLFKTKCNGPFYIYHSWRQNEGGWDFYHLIYPAQHQIFQQECVITHEPQLRMLEMRDGLISAGRDNAALPVKFRKIVRQIKCQHTGLLFSLYIGFYMGGGGGGGGGKKVLKN